MATQSAGGAEYINCISPNGCLGYDTEQSDGFSNAGALGNVEHPFIAITPRSTPAHSGSIW